MTPQAGWSAYACFAARRLGRAPGSTDERTGNGNAQVDNRHVSTTNQMQKDRNHNAQGRTPIHKAPASSATTAHAGNHTCSRGQHCCPAALGFCVTLLGERHVGNPARRRTAASQTAWQSAGSTPADGRPTDSHVRNNLTARRGGSTGRPTTHPTPVGETVGLPPLRGAVQETVETSTGPCSRCIMSTQEGQTEWNAATGSSAREAPDHNHRAPASRPDPEGTQSDKGAVSWMLWDRPVRPMSTSGGPQDRQGHSQSLAHHHLQRIWAQHSSLASPAAQTDQSRGHVDRPSALLCQRGPAEFTEFTAVDNNISAATYSQHSSTHQKSNPRLLLKQWPSSLLENTTPRGPTPRDKL